MKKIMAAVIAASLLLVAAPVAADGHIPSTVETVVAVSGDPGDFDRDKKDFDILRELVLLAGLGDALGGEGLEDITVLAPNDKAFQRLAKDLGYDGKYDEGAILGFLAGGLTAYANANGTDVISVITDVLLYHVTDEAYTNKELKKADSVDTLLAPLASKNKKFLDAEEDLKNAKLQGVKDVATSNGYIQGIDRVLIPVDLVG